MARSLGKSSGWVTQRIALLNLTPELKQAVSEKTLPLDVARAVGQPPEQQQQSAAENELKQRASRKRARTKTTGQPAPSPSKGSVHRSATEPAESQAVSASIDSDEELQSLAQELRDRLTAEQVEKLIELLMR